ncbi:MAG: glycerol-3-phosphate ABC transporter ATP-binding protein, partial [Mesorhizobium sp.]
MAALDLHIDKIGKRYGETDVLHDVSLEAAPGEFVTLLGPSG